MQEKRSTEKCLKEFYDSDVGRLVKRHADNHPAMAALVSRAARSCGLDRLAGGAKRAVGTNEGFRKVKRLPDLSSFVRLRNATTVNARRPATRARAMQCASVQAVGPACTDAVHDPREPAALLPLGRLRRHPSGHQGGGPVGSRVRHRQAMRPVCRVVLTRWPLLSSSSLCSQAL